MTYNKQLPDMESLDHLVRRCGPFPVTRRELVRRVRLWGMDGPILDFLRLFPSDQIFESRREFLTRAEELTEIITQELESPVETRLSPQD